MARYDVMRKTHFRETKCLDSIHATFWGRLFFQICFSMEFIVTSKKKSEKLLDRIT